MEGARAVRADPRLAECLSDSASSRACWLTRAFAEDRARALPPSRISDLAGRTAPPPRSSRMPWQLCCGSCPRLRCYLSPRQSEAGLRAFRPADTAARLSPTRRGPDMGGRFRRRRMRTRRASLAGLPPRSAVWIVVGDAKDRTSQELIRQVKSRRCAGIVVIGEDRAPLEALQAVRRTFPTWG